MRVAVEEMAGVDSAAVSLNRGEVRVALADGNAVTLEALRAAIRDQGFTPREADLRLRALPRLRDGNVILEVPGGDWTLRVTGAEDTVRTLSERAGRAVVVEGRVEEEATDRIRVTAVAPSSQP